MGETVEMLRVAVPALALFAIMLSAPAKIAWTAASTSKIGIVEQQLANPFFGKLEQSTVAAAGKHGLQTTTAESTAAGDSTTQVAAIENMINQHVKAIVLHPGSAFALVPIVSKTRAAGIVVVTTNTSLQPPTAADASFETNNLAAGVLIGRWARARL